MSHTPIILRKTVVPVSYGIEIEGRSEYLRDNLGKHIGFFYITTDGSLAHHDSVEVVSQPLPVNMLVRCLKSFKKKYGEITPENDAGIHIHVTRTPKTEERLKEFYVFLLINNLSDFLFFFGRHENYYARWSHSPDRVFVQRERYAAINFQNTNTIEIRAFGNKLCNTNGIEAGIQYVKRINALLNTKKPISMDLLRNIAEQFPLKELQGE